MKQCFKCQRELPLSDFYKHKQMTDGHLNKCKECAKKDAKEVRGKNIDYYREYDRNRPNARERNRKFLAAEKERLKDPAYREKRNALKKRWAEENTIKRAAHIITGNAIRDGKLIKQPCEKCGELKVEAHHYDYSRPLEVNWLCKKCHAEHHKLERTTRRKVKDGN